MNPLLFIKRIALPLVAALTVTYAQSTASLSGRILDPSALPVPGAALTLSNPVSRIQRTTASLPDGSFSFTNLPFQSYELVVSKPGFGPARQNLELRSNVPVAVTIRLQVEQAQTALDVLDYERGMLIDPSQTGTQAQMNQSDIERLATQSRGLEGVLLSFPGFAQNANGAIHPRGAHNQLTFVLDGMPITDQLSGAFANAIDPNIVQTVELFTGNIPAEYGSKTAAVANVTTRSGAGSGRLLQGSATANASAYDTFSGMLQASGERGRLGYSGSFQSMKSNRYLDQVSLDNLHNGGNLERGFARLDIQASPRDLVRLNFMSGRSSLQLANLRSQHEAGMAQRQRLEDASTMLGWVRTLDPRTTFDATASVRTAESLLLPSAGDTPVTAWQSRRTTTLTLWNRINRMQGAHTLKAGFDFQHFPVQERFRFGVTSPSFNDPQSGGFIPTLAAHDLTRGGREFQFARRAAGQLYTGFLQDSVRWGRFQFALGLRYDLYQFLVRGNQWQPRVGLSYHLKETGTVLRASYNRTFQTPPTENLLLSSSEESTALVAPNVRETLGGGLAQIRPERQNLYEAGIQQALFGRLSLNVSYYRKKARDQQDNNNFFNTGVIFPMALAGIDVRGAEARLVVPEYRGLSGTFSLTHARAISRPPFTGGLFIGNSAVEILSAGPFYIDHDQKLSTHAVIRYARKGLYSTTSIRYDSGLVVNPSNPAQVAADPDYADLLPYVNLTSSPPRAKPRTITDVVIGYERGEPRRWDLSLTISNLFNTTAVYNFQSLFVGTRIVQPRSAGLRLRWFF